MDIHFLAARATPLACATALFVSFGANAQTAPGGGAGAQPGTAGTAQSSSPAGVQPSSPTSAQPGQTSGAQPPSPSGSEPSSTPSTQRQSPSVQGDVGQPAYPSSDPPRGTTPQQREQVQQRGAAGAAESNTGMCNQEDALARSECLRRDMTDDDDRPAGVTRSMQQRREAQERAQQNDSMNVASEADTGSDQAGARSRTRTASSSLPEPEDQADQDRDDDASDTAEQPATEANNDSDTLGSER